jgi:hypothetical protein
LMRRPRREPPRAQPMQRGEQMLIYGLDGNGKNLFVAVGLEQRLGVGAIVLAPASIGSHQVWWKKNHAVPKAPEPSGPEMSRAAGLEQHRCRGSFWQRTTPAWSDSVEVAPTPYQPGARRQPRRRSLQDPRRSSYGSSGLLLFESRTHADFGTSMPFTSARRSPSHHFSGVANLWWQHRVVEGNNLHAAMLAENEGHVRCKRKMLIQAPSRVPSGARVR